MEATYVHAQSLGGRLIVGQAGRQKFCSLQLFKIQELQFWPRLGCLNEFMAPISSYLQINDQY